MVKILAGPKPAGSKYCVSPKSKILAGPMRKILAGLGPKYPTMITVQLVLLDAIILSPTCKILVGPMRKILAGQMCRILADQNTEG